ncbi:SHOCT domain-containing protein [Cryobacterium glucosi]|uniref:SHOCT domain-containing protein n=1 Tax=Cryobacterium glucosi TaxID=1259175 RepID=A0ABY2IQ33_9MICO|nr:SHOCT domain-containing protein [Cryobacterium glucosi]TFC22454.1 SHOCT domain-containing protein [Cryobacterium glucosi]
MAFGRRSRGLAASAARTAVIVGTATATSNAVHGSAARKQAAAAAAAPAVAAPIAATAPVAIPPAAPQEDIISKIERLAALHTAGALTDAEFALLKAQAIA